MGPATAGQAGVCTRLAALAVAASAVVGSSGCGGAGSSQSARKEALPLTPPPTVTEQIPPASHDEPIGEVGEASRSQAKPRRRPERAPAPRRSSPDAGSVSSPPSPDPVKAVRRAVSSALAASGYGGAEIDVLDGGRTVRVAVGRAQACARGAAAEVRLVDRIKARARAVKAVTITVAGTGRDLSAYQRTGCASPRPEEGGGEDVVYAKKGTGPFTTPAFSIKGRSWTVSYRNESDFFQAFVIKDGRFQPVVLSSERPGSGSEALRGPGRFRLKINAAAGWAVTVRDGA
jgi:hypothetical protein